MASRPRLSSSWVVMVVLASVVAALAGVVPPSAAGPERFLFIDPHRTAVDPSSYVTMIGDADEPVSLGAQLIYRADDEIWVGGDEHDVLVRIGDRDGRASLLDLTFSAPAGRSLQPGTYAVPARLPSGSPPPGSADLSITVGGSVCHGEGGSSFTVHDLAPDLSHFWIGYELRCGSFVGAPVVRGQVRVDLPSPPLLVTAEQVRWSATYPGRDHTPQLVHVVNAGLVPLALGRPAVSGPFDVDTSACAVVPPGGECALAVAYRATTNDVQTGRLVVPTSAGSAVDLSLLGVGDAGHTQVAVQHLQASGETRDEYASLETHESFQVVGDRRFLSLAFEGPHVDDHQPVASLVVIAPRGRRLQEGQVYSGAMGSVSSAGLPVEPQAIPLRLDAAWCRGRVTPPRVTATVTFPYLDYRADGSVAGFHLVGRIDCDGGELVTVVASYQSPSATPPFPPSARVILRPRRVGEGRTWDVAVTAYAALGHEVNRVTVHAVTRDGRRRLVAAGQPDARGAVRVTVPVSERTTFVAQSYSGAARLAMGAASFTRLKSLTSAVRGIAPLGPRAFPSSRRRVAVDLRTLPATRGACITVQVQRLLGDRWVARRGPACRPMNRWGRGVVRFAVHPGQKLRVRGVWAADRTSDAAVSPWQRFRVKRR
ncbi:hypothetical protein ABFT23_09760 [Nocardioides sp. C4-1]|uniref:hypothetical protein n=1 Tax=Nocardioides sp. C4-1 TaxID=3151851 RepID=UPI0032653D57